MDLQEVDRVIKEGNFKGIRQLLGEIDEVRAAQARIPILNPASLRQATRLLTTAINGEDGRLDVAALLRPRSITGLTSSRPVEFQSAAHSSQAVALLADVDLLQLKGGRLKLTTAIFGQVNELCSSERFFARPVATPATAFLVQDDLLVTLRHNLDFFSSFGKIRAIFDFELQDAQDESSCKLEFAEEEIYAVTERYSLVDQSRNAFVALRLNRPVIGRTPLVCNFGQPLKSGQDVYMIGHPYGLPKLYFGNAKVLDASSGDAFTASLDAFAGTSGAPVINSQTGQVEGVLAEGGDDFQWITNADGVPCNFSIVHEDEPFGYKVKRIQKLQRLLDA